MEGLLTEYWSVRAEYLKLNASNELAPFWEQTFEILSQSLRDLDQIRAAALKLSREHQTADIGGRLTLLDQQSEELLRELADALDKMPSVIAAMKKIAENRASFRPPASLPRRSRSLLLFSDSDWKLLDLDIAALFNLREHVGQHAGLVPFVEWVIKHMAVSGERKHATGKCACGMPHCGGYKQQQLIAEYLKQHPACSVARSVFANTAAPSLTVMWNFDVALKKRLQQRSIESDGSAVDYSAPAAGQPGAAAADPALQDLPSSTSAAGGGGGAFSAGGGATAAAAEISDQPAHAVEGMTACGSEGVLVSAAQPSGGRRLFPDPAASCVGDLALACRTTGAAAVAHAATAADSAAGGGRGTETAADGAAARY